MASVGALTRVSSRVSSRSCGLLSSLARRSLHQTKTCFAITNLEMPAMSPTMTEGGIAGWKKLQGEPFVAGDVLLEIETDKATIDVEAQEDGVMGKILLPDGSKNVPVGKVIALLAEEGDDISNLEAPKESPKPAAAAQEPPKRASEAPSTPISDTPSPNVSHSSPLSHSRPLFPSVHRLLVEHNISNPEAIKGTGVRGMLTKGDVLAYLGKASGPTGTYKENREPVPGAKPTQKSTEPKPLDGQAIRQLIVSSMLQASIRTRNIPPASHPTADFESIIADYLPPNPKQENNPVPVPLTKLTSAPDYLDGLI